MSELQRQLGLGTATSVVIANMVGAGIFTTTGLMLREVASPALVMLAWFLGGLIALAGALCYAELATRFPRAGGEYVYLRELYGPLPAFLTGWTSFFVGFSAPIAASAAGAAAYLGVALWPRQSTVLFVEGFLSIDAQRLLALGIVVAFSLIHALGVRLGARVQNALTILKLTLLSGMLAAGAVTYFAAPPAPQSAALFAGTTHWAGFGVAMLWVMFAYSGWNAAAYIAEEVREPARTLPRALLGGTLVVMLLYLGINVQFFAIPDVSRLQGEITVFEIAVSELFGTNAGLAAALLVFFALLSSLSAYVLIGPRVYFAMARDALFFRAAAAIHPKFGTPARAIWAQCACAGVMVLTATFDQLLTYIGFALGIFPLLAVTGLFIVRKRDAARTGGPWPAFFPLRVREERRRDAGGTSPAVYRAWGYPATPLFFLAAMTAILVVSFAGRPKESSIALATVAAGIPAYFLMRAVQQRRGEL